MLQRPRSNGSSTQVGAETAFRTVRRPSGEEIYATVVPGDVAASSPVAQAEDVARQRDRLIEELGGDDVIVTQETWHLDQPATKLPLADAHHPARTFVVQPLLAPVAACALELHAVRGAAFRRQAPTPGAASSVVEPSAHVLVAPSGHRHVRIGNVLPDSPGGGRRAPFEELFDRAETLLRENGARFTDVVRTWLYLREMERDYDFLNDARRAFFERAGVRTHPASTGIGGAPLDPDRDVCLSLYAIVGDSEAERMRSATFNEAPEYGALFSRGICVRGEGATYYISGTAAVDHQGRSVGGDDLVSQVSKMLENVRGLLEGVGSELGRAVQATSYLKHRSDLGEYLELLERAGFPEIPHVVVEAEVCRPELLCEIELISS